MVSTSLGPAGSTVDSGKAEHTLGHSYLEIIAKHVQKSIDSSAVLRCHLGTTGGVLEKARALVKPYAAG